MFDFLKRKKKKGQEEAPVEVAVQKKPENVYLPPMGTLEEFLSTYKTGAEHLSIGRFNGHAVNLTCLLPPADSLFVVNCDNEDVCNTLITPLVEQKNLSYVIYDPDNRYYDLFATKLKLQCYDVQCIDLADAEHNSRIDVFEIVNITNNAYWTAVMLSGSIKCTADEILAAHNLFMMLMEYDLATVGATSIESMSSNFAKFYAKDAELLSGIEGTKAKIYLDKFNASCDADTKLSVFKKVYAYLFKDLANKMQNPNIFSVTSHKKQTITFVKSVPAQYKSLLTIFLFNLKASALTCDIEDATTLIIDTSKDDWYDRGMLSRMCSEINNKMDKSTISLVIRPDIGHEDFEKEQLIIYMQSDNDAAKDSVFENLKLKSWGDLWINNIKSASFSDKPMTDDVLESAPVSRESLDKREDCLLIDTTRKIRPMKFQTW